MPRARHRPLRMMPPRWRRRPHSLPVCSGAMSRRLTPWFFPLLANLGHNRQQSRRVRRVGVLSDITPSAAGQPDAVALQTEIRERFMRAVGALSDRQREVIMLHDVEGWTTGDIGEALALSPQTVRWHLHDARKTLRVA